MKRLRISTTDRILYYIIIGGALGRYFDPKNPDVNARNRKFHNAISLISSIRRWEWEIRVVMWISDLGFNGNGSLGLQRELFVCYFATEYARATAGGRGEIRRNPKLFSIFYCFGKSSYNNNQWGFRNQNFQIWKNVWWFKWIELFGFETFVVTKIERLRHDIWSRSAKVGKALKKKQKNMYNKKIIELENDKNVTALLVDFQPKVFSHQPIRATTR